LDPEQRKHQHRTVRKDPSDSCAHHSEQHQARHPCGAHAPQEKVRARPSPATERRSATLGSISALTSALSITPGRGIGNASWFGGQVYISDTVDRGQVLLFQISGETARPRPSPFRELRFPCGTPRYDQLVRNAAMHACVGVEGAAHVLAVTPTDFREREYEALGQTNTSLSRPRPGMDRRPQRPSRMARLAAQALIAVTEILYA
jgi:hypothetical protein